MFGNTYSIKLQESNPLPPDDVDPFDTGEANAPGGPFDTGEGREAFERDEDGWVWDTGEEGEDDAQEELSSE